MPRHSLLLLLWATGCYAGSVEPPAPTYRNPLDLLDGGSGPGDGGRSPDAGGSRSVGTVDGISPDLFAATYIVEIDDAGVGRTSIYVTDVADLCQAIASDGGLGPVWNLLRFRIAGDAPAAYTVAPVLPPSGAIAEFDYQEDGGGFGFSPATSGSLELDSVDTDNVQPAIGTYTVNFAGSDSLTGSFVAAPCSLAPPAPGGA